MCNAALKACWDSAALFPRPRDATELNNDRMIKSGDVHYQTEPNLSIFPKEV